MQAHAQASGVHGGLQQCPGPGRGTVVAGQQLRRPGEILCDPSLVSAFKHEGQQSVSAGGLLPCHGQGCGIENVRYWDAPAGQKLPRPCVRVRLPQVGPRHVNELVFGP